jgi:hypothetical protein
MKANEFRVGNYHTYKIEDNFDERKEWTDVFQIDYEDIAWLSTSKGQNDEDYGYVKLSEKWLDNLGFVKEGRSYVMGVHQRLFSGLMKLTFNGKLQMWVFSIGKYSDLTRVEFVHQLQNLYYALTGEELQSSRLEKPSA